MPETPPQPAVIPDAPADWTSADHDTVHRARTDGGLRATIARALWNRDYQPGAEAQIGGYIYEIADKVAAALTETAGERSDAGPLQAAPESTEASQRAVSRFLGSPDDPTASETSTALRERYADAIRASALPGLSVQGATDAALAVRNDELERLRRELAAARAACGDAPAIAAWARAFNRAMQAEAAVDRAHEAEAAVERAKALHPRDDSNPRGPWCGTCLTVWPCPTIRALDGGEQAGGNA